MTAHGKGPSATTAPDRSTRPAVWPWVALALALAWSTLVRVPLVLNAAIHLDSDLAVDGLTLLEAAHGHWRWHYPGTPAMGTLPVLLSLPQALLWGANPVTLVSGGVVAQGLLTIAVFLLAWRGFGPGAAVWSLLPLAFASTGTLWLSGRITGGHLLTAAWHAGAFALLHEAIARGGRGRVLTLGLLCGLGFALDTMFLMTLSGLVAAGCWAWWRSRPSRRALGCCGLFALAFAAGAWPREVGRWIEPHDAYREQFRPIWDVPVLKAHTRLLALECLPRLVAGHRLPGLQADPDPRTLSGPGPMNPKPDGHPSAVAVTAVGLGLFAMAGFAIVWTRSTTIAAGAVRLGLIVSATAVCAGFILNRNIYNADNYRYLVTLLVPWALGFGLALDVLTRRGRGGMVAGCLCGVVLAGLMTLDTARWYARFGWIDSRGVPVALPLDDPALAWLDAHREVGSLFGDYWDVYRLSFLTGGRVRGVPFPIFPDRFPEWSRDLPRGHPEVLVVRGGRQAAPFLGKALGAGGRILLQARGITIVSWP